jgi:hypothetical protein
MDSCPVSPLDNDGEYLIEYAAECELRTFVDLWHSCIAIHGWGSHALGGSKLMMILMFDFAIPY